MNSNSKSISTIVKMDLYNQALKLQQTTPDSQSQLNELIDSLKSSEVEEIVEQQRTWLRSIFQAWRLQSIKTYNVYQVASFTEKLRLKQMGLLFYGWHDYIESSLTKQTLLYRFKLKWGKVQKARLLKAWSAVIWEMQQKQLKKYEASQFNMKRIKRKHFLKWKLQINRQLNGILAQDQLINQQKLKLYTKYFNIMKHRLHWTENFLSTYLQKKQKSQMSSILYGWLQYVKYFINQKKVVKEFIDKRNSQTKFQVFLHIKNKSEKHLLLRRQNLLAYYGRWKMLVSKSFNFLVKYKNYQQSKRYLKSLREQNQLKLVFLTIQQIYQLNKKYNEVVNQINYKKLKQTFYKIQTFTQKSKYKKYSQQFADLFRLKSQQKSLLSLLKLYHSYQFKKREMYEKMMQLHLVKLCKNIFKKWQQYNKKTHQKRVLELQIQLSHQYRVKKQILSVMISRQKL